MENPGYGPGNFMIPTITMFLSQVSNLNTISADSLLQAKKDVAAKPTSSSGGKAKKKVH
jgi:hypothetical protein